MIFVSNKIFTYANFYKNYGHKFKKLGLDGLEIPESSTVFTLWTKNESAFGGVFLGKAKENILPAYHSFFYVECDSYVHDTLDLFYELSERFYEELLEALIDYPCARSKNLLITQTKDEYIDTINLGGWEYDSCQNLSEHLVSATIDLSSFQNVTKHKAA